MENKILDLKLKANDIRQSIVSMLNHAGSGHPGGSLSAVEILTALYFDVMKHNPEKPDWPERDRFILSKGHGVPVLYATLAHAGYIEMELLPTLRKYGSPLQGHPDKRKMSVLETSTGSLGQGLSIGIGMAMAAKLDKKQYHTFVLMGDGETNEGQVWEAAMFAAHKKLDNLVAIVDYNGFQLDDSTNEILNLEPYVHKWKSFGWNVIEIDGHKMEAVLTALREARQANGQPVAVIAHTVKGKGVSFMENNNKYHGVAPGDEELQTALDELNAERDKLLNENQQGIK